MFETKRICLLSMCVITMALVAESRAAVITPISVTTGSLSDATALKENLINHNGLNAATLQHTSSFNTQNHWRTTTAANAIELTFDLGATFALNQTLVWNYNEAGGVSTNRGMNGVTISFSNDNVTFTSPQNVNFTQANGLNTYAGETTAFGSTVEARYVKFTTTSTYGSNNGFTGLSEVRFNTVTTEIEPVAVSHNQPNSNGGATFGIANLTNNSGMSGAGLELATPAASGNGFTGMWRLQDGLNGVNIEDTQLTFDFGAVTEIGSAKIWNYSEDAQTNRGINQIEVFESLDGISFDSLGIFSLTESPDGQHTLHNVLDFSYVEARYLRFDVLDQTPGNTGYFGLNEVRFFAPVASAIPVPEPASVAMWSLVMLIGGVFAARACRRGSAKRRKSAA